MPRPMLRMQQNSQQQSQASLNLMRDTNRQQQMQLNKMQIDRLLRKKRSPQYMEALRQLDAGGHVQNQAKVNEILRIIRDEFPEVELAGLLLGFVSICYLGKPYEVHSLDMTGNIIEHYKGGQAMPGGLEKARSIALHGGYEYIEVYSDCCRAVSSDGSIAVIPC